MSGETYRQGMETTNEVMAGRSTAAIEHVTSWMISLHVRDRHLKGLKAVARQQPSPLFTAIFYFLTSFLSGEKCKGSGISLLPFAHFNTETVNYTREPTSHSPQLLFAA